MNLYLIPTTLAANTSKTVLPPQVIETIQKTKVFFVENVRTTRRFISELRLGIEIDSLTFFELTKDTPVADTKSQLLQLQAQKIDAGIISEAGCPGIADPGAVAANIAHTLGFRVVPLVGPNSIMMALMASGFNGQSFTFLGYLPIDKAPKIKEIQRIEQEAKRKRQTQIFMETPFRNNHMFDDIVANCQPETMLCVAANITAVDEFIKTDSIKNWKKNKPELHKIPCIFLIL